MKFYFSNFDFQKFKILLRFFRQSEIVRFFKDEPIEREVNQTIFSYWAFALPPNQETTVTRTLPEFGLIFFIISSTHKDAVYPADPMIIDCSSLNFIGK